MKIRVESDTPKPMADLKKISACVLTKNNGRTIAKCLQALAPFGEILVLDTGSTDNTIDIAQARQGVRLLRQDGVGNFGKTRNLLAAQAANDWILMVDSDEILTPELVGEIQNLQLDSQAAYAILRINHYGNRPIRGCHWENDFNNRLYDRRATAWEERAVHESLLIPAGGRSIRLRHAMNHFSCEDAAHYMRKTIWYAELHAEAFKGRKRGGTVRALLHGGWTFFRCYVLHRGFLFGRDGFVISRISASGSFFKYVFLARANRRLAREKMDYS